jgi:phosphoribosylformylglycinamidine cyclo-ligase
MRPQAVFGVLQDLGRVSDQEMYQIFNMGMGFCMVVPDRQADAAVKAAGKGAKIVGQALKSDSIAVPDMGLKYSKY